MDLKSQIQSLIDNAPQDGVTPQMVASIAPVLISIALKLRHPQYYILQNKDNRWVLTTLVNKTQPNLQKQAIYAYSDQKNLTASMTSGLDAQPIAQPIPVTHILFQLLAMEPVDSIVFFETSGTQERGVEISRADLLNQIQQHLQKQHRTSDIPPDIA